MGDVLDQRRESTNGRLEDLRGRLGDAAERASGKACVYATGSFARAEAGRFSDLDLFIVGGETPKLRLLNRLDEICIKAELIEATRDLGIPEFSNDGEYLTHFTVEELVAGLGKPEDDSKNTFTARLLLLLESRPLLGEAIYSEAIDQVIKAYWRDYEDHKTEFVPAFLANDVLRLWRTFCVNYEARTAREPEAKKAKRKLKNYKLKHSRLLTCYSALTYLLAIYRKKSTVAPEDVVAMVRLSPTQRLEWLRSQNKAAHAKLVDDLLAQYERFLTLTDEREAALIATFRDASKSRHLVRSAYEFGDKMFELLKATGTDSRGRKNRFYRLLVV